MMLLQDIDSRATVQRIMARLPVAIVTFLLGGTYILFIIFVTIKQVLIVHQEYGRFLLQFVVYHTLLILSVASFVAAVSHRPITPDQDLAPHDARPLRPDEVRPLPPVGPPATTVTGMDEDDIPLRLLRDGRSPQPGGDNADGEDSAGSRGSAGHRSPKRRGSGALGGADGDEHFDGNADDEEDDALLPKGPDPEATLMAKGATGGPRWCRKCDGWKPDRCHHCRSCRQCILKMDHHCPWIDNCVGFHNYKPFLLFLTYTSLLSFFGCSQAVYEVFRFFNDPLDVDINEGAHAAAVQDEMEDLRFALRPVVFMLLAVLGVAFSIAVGSLCGYHWYLALNNRTTLEEMHRSVPTALLDPPTRALLETLGDRGSRNRTPGAWRPDHILTRPERNRLREGARGINVYDIGWRRNLRSVLVGEDALPPTTWRGSLDEVLGAMWPLSRPKTRRYGAGHFFTHDPSSLLQLKTLTSELRLGLEPGVEPASGTGGVGESGDVPPPPGAPAGLRRFDVGQVWEIGDAESDTDSDGSATLIDGRHPRRSLEWRG